ncbi:hypothetical protein HAX54_007879, partial [Datura stramonium]|nr:hypothetical protein [Datura stramonium]
MMYRQWLYGRLLGIMFQFDLETDSLLLKNAINGTWKPPWWELDVEERKIVNTTNYNVHICECELLGDEDEVDTHEKVDKERDNFPSYSILRKESIGIPFLLLILCAFLQ